MRKGIPMAKETKAQLSRIMKEKFAKGLIEPRTKPDVVCGRMYWNDTFTKKIRCKNRRSKDRWNCGMCVRRPRKKTFKRYFPMRGNPQIILDIWL